MTNDPTSTSSKKRPEILGHDVVATIHDLPENAVVFARAFGNSISFGQLDNVIAAVETSIVHNGHSYDENRRLEYGKTWHKREAAEVGSVAGSAALVGALLFLPPPVQFIRLPLMMAGVTTSAFVNLEHHHQATPTPPAVFQDKKSKELPRQR